MQRLAADENFNGDIVRGLLRRNPKLDIVAFKTWASLVRMTPHFCNGPPTRSASSSRTTSRRWRSTRSIELQQVS